jgi:hypothetical protein
MSRLRAELVSDNGAAAAEETAFFRAPSFLRAESVTHSLVISDGTVVLPIIRREIPGGGYDAISPYGYPGGRLVGEPPHVDDVDFAGTGLVSLFVRERLAAPALLGGLRRGRLLLHNPTKPREIHPRIATKVRSNDRRGYHAAALPGPDVGDALLAAFAVAYTETMKRGGAAKRYFFSIPYLRFCLNAPTSWAVVVSGPEGDVAAAAIAVISDGFLHYYLGGTADVHRDASPAKNLMVGMMDLADKLVVPLNLGGGISPGDSLERFKAGFANCEDEFASHRIVCNPTAYDRLTAGRNSGDFFPSYRSAQS